ncbi:TPA: iron-sulfur cluster assembly scaffold protein [Candidatus Woesearchaeota archaeon]|nr:iron-sulfur cluster assembly scaffold protein [Candidatus Woesearchaeota archaeon]
MYSEKVICAFKDPKNMGEIENPDGSGKVGNPSCGDLMQVHIKVGKNKKGEDIIEDCKVKTFGCVAAIATSSTMTEMVIGKTIQEAKKLTNMDVADELGGLPPLKVHCSNLAADALKKAIEDYEKKGGKQGPVKSRK